MRRSYFAHVTLAALVFVGLNSAFLQTTAKGQDNPAPSVAQPATPAPAPEPNNLPPRATDRQAPAPSERIPAAPPPGGALAPSVDQPAKLQLDPLKPFIQMPTPAPKSDLEIWMPAIGAGVGVIGVLGGFLLARLNLNTTIRAEFRKLERQFTDDLEKRRIEEEEKRTRLLTLVAAETALFKDRAGNRKERWQALNDEKDLDSERFKWLRVPKPLFFELKWDEASTVKNPRILAWLAVLKDLSNRIDSRIDYIIEHREANDAARSDYIATLGQRYDDCVEVAEKVIAELKNSAAKPIMEELKGMFDFLEKEDDVARKTPDKSPNSPSPEPPKSGAQPAAAPPTKPARMNVIRNSQHVKRKIEPIIAPPNGDQPAKDQSDG